MRVDNQLWVHHCHQLGWSRILNLQNTVLLNIDFKLHSYFMFIFFFFRVTCNLFPCPFHIHTAQMDVFQLSVMFYENCALCFYYMKTATQTFLEYFGRPTRADRDNDVETEILFRGIPPVQSFVEKVCKILSKKIDVCWWVREVICLNVFMKSTDTTGTKHHSHMPESYLFINASPTNL